MVKKKTFEEILDSEGRLVYTSVGTSMLPLIRQEKDLLVIEKPSGRLKKYDIALYRRDNGKCVLHRILRVRKNDYVICGDNQWRVEYGITDRHIIGVLRERIRDGRTESLNAPRFRLYAHLWCDLFPVRAMLLRGRYMSKRCISLLISMKKRRMMKEKLTDDH